MSAEWAHVDENKGWLHNDLEGKGKNKKLGKKWNDIAAGVCDIYIFLEKKEREKKKNKEKRQKRKRISRPILHSICTHPSCHTGCVKAATTSRVFVGSHSALRLGFCESLDMDIGGSGCWSARWIIYLESVLEIVAALTFSSERHAYSCACAWHRFSVLQQVQSDRAQHLESYI